MEVAHAEPEMGHSEINHPVKKPTAFMAAADTKCAVYEGDHSFELLFVVQRIADVL